MNFILDPTLTPAPPSTLAPTQTPSPATIINVLPPHSGTPLWVTIVVGLGGAILGLLVSGITLWATAQRQTAQNKAEESRLLSTEGREALSEYLAATTRFEMASRPPVSEMAEAWQTMQVAVARVQIICSVKVAGIASMMLLTAQLAQSADSATDRSKMRQRLLERHRDLIRTARDELGLNDPVAGQPRGNSWLVRGPVKADATTTEQSK